MKEYRIARFYGGKGGYPERYEYCELQEWNDVYGHWYSITTAFLDLEFVKNYCTIKKIDFESIPHTYISKENDNKKERETHDFQK